MKINKSLWKNRQKCYLYWKPFIIYLKQQRPDMPVVIHHMLCKYNDKYYEKWSPLYTFPMYLDEHTTYHIKHGQLNNKGKKFSELHKKHLSETHKNKPNLKLKGHLVSLETRGKISDKNKGKHYSPQTEFKVGNKKGLPSGSSKKVLCIETNEIFDSASRASASLGFEAHAVAKSIGRNGSCGNFYWRYI